jgi:subtilisin family serine protease
MCADTNTNPGALSSRQRAARGATRRSVASRAGRFMIASTRPEIGEQALKDRLAGVEAVEILHMLAPRGPLYPPVAVVRMPRDEAAALQRSAGAALIVEPDQALCAASVSGTAPSAYAPSGANALGRGFATTIEVLGDGDRPLDGADVQLIGQRWSAQGITGVDGKVALTLYGELPQNVEELIVRPRGGYWGLWQRGPELAAEAVNSLTLQPLAAASEPGWGALAMQIDRLPAEYRGRGAKIALVDTGVATTHSLLRHIDRGVEIGGADGRTWSKDPAGHGTPSAGVIAAVVDGTAGIRGLAPEAELHVCSLPRDACCSDLAAAIDYCVGGGIDVACIGFGCARGSAIVEQRIAAASQRAGLAVVAAAGSAGGPVQFPACSCHVLAVAAIGGLGTFPSDSPQAAHAATAAAASGGLFVPAFSCGGLELDLCAPGVAVVACRSPDGYALCDGTSIAAAHVAALAALVLAHHADFRRDFATRNGLRAERVFQILKETAQPIGQPWQTGAGLPDAARALGRPSQVRSMFVPLQVGLAEMRNAIRSAGLSEAGVDDVAFALLPRGAATVTRLPLNPSPFTATPVEEGDATIKDLKAAMRVAGLSAAG